ncbi:hypothetical protein D021_0502A, partial [Vibrio parahaemolyticus 10296]|jgi:glycerate kinase
MCRI